LGEGLLGVLEKAFTATSASLLLVGALFGAYALLEGVEAVGPVNGHSPQNRRLR